MRKQLANKIIRETENMYFFFTPAGIYREIDKGDKRAKFLVKCNTSTLMENLFNKKIDDNRLTDVLARLKTGDTIETLERYLKPEKHLAYKVLKETLENGKNMYYYFDNNGLFTKSPYLVPLIFPIDAYDFTSYVLGIEIQKKVFEMALYNMELGSTIQDLEKEILKTEIPSKKECWYEKMFHFARIFPFNK